MIDSRYYWFYVVATERHFTRAAQKLFRTQSAVSQAMAGLERDLGQRLFRHEGKSLYLTQAGEILLAECQAMTQIGQNIQVRLANLRELTEGRLTISASNTTASYYLPAPLATFHADYPGIQLRILNGVTSQAIDWLAEGACDLGLVTLPITKPQLRSFPLFRRADVLICAPGSKHLSRRPPHLADLQHVPFLYPEAQSQTRHYLDTVFQAHGIQPPCEMEIRGFEIIKKYVEQDFGVSIVPEMAVTEAAAAGRLEIWPLFAPEEQRQMALIAPAAKTLPRSAIVFASYLGVNLT